MASPGSKLCELSEAASLVAGGSMLGLGGLMMTGAPMSFCRELVRAGTSDLDVVAVSGGMDVDWLVAGGCARRVLTAIVSFEGFGLAPSFRRAAESGLVVEDWSELTMLCAFQAAITDVPYIPTRAGLGTDVPRHLPEVEHIRRVDPTGMRERG